MPDLPCRGEGVNPTSMAQNDTHVALIILTTQMSGGKLLVEKTFLGQILCSCAFGANIRSYTKQRARHGTPFLQPPPPPSFGGRPCHPPPPPPQSNFQVALAHATGLHCHAQIPLRVLHGMRRAPDARQSAQPLSSCPIPPTNTTLLQDCTSNADPMPRSPTPLGSEKSHPSRTPHTCRPWTRSRTS